MLPLKNLNRGLKILKELKMKIKISKKTSNKAFKIVKQFSNRYWVQNNLRILKLWNPKLAYSIENQETEYHQKNQSLKSKKRMRWITLAKDSWSSLVIMKEKNKKWIYLFEKI